MDSALPLVPNVGVMISSTRADLQEYRDAAAEVIRRVFAERASAVHLSDHSMEAQVQRGDREWSVAASRRWVGESSWVVLIVGFHYGSVSGHPEAKGLSHTEWEYQEAVDRKKKIFVFMAGAPGQANAYRRIEVERRDLAEWRNGPDREEIERFRQELSGCYVQVFSNLTMFRDELERTIRSQIDQLVRPSGSALAHLVTAVSDATDNFTDKVERIADCKAVHDRLHELLQNVIGPLHDDLLPLWREEGELNTRRLIRLTGLMAASEREQGEIETLRRSFVGDDNELAAIIDGVLAEGARLYPGHEPLLDRDKFEALLEDFGDVVNRAFARADRHMGKGMAVLAELRDDLLHDIEQARIERPLSSSEDERVALWLDEVALMLRKLTDAIDTHHEWQEVHEAIGTVEGHRGHPSFRTQLGGLCRDELPRLARLVSDELRVAANGRAAISPRPALLVSGSLCSDSEPGLNKLQQRLVRLDADRTEENFDEVRKPFDACFYCVDKRTLAEVEVARDSVTRFKQLRDDLLRAHPIRPPAAVQTEKVA